MKLSLAFSLRVVLLSLCYSHHASGCCDTHTLERAANEVTIRVKPHLVHGVLENIIQRRTLGTATVILVRTSIGYIALRTAVLFNRYNLKRAYEYVACGERVVGVSIV